MRGRIEISGLLHDHFQTCIGKPVAPIDPGRHTTRGECPGHFYREALWGSLLIRYPSGCYETWPPSRMACGCSGAAMQSGRRVRSFIGVFDCSWAGKHALRTAPPLCLALGNSDGMSSDVSVPTASFRASRRTSPRAFNGTGCIPWFIPPLGLVRCSLLRQNITAVDP